jgi:hypothetical protein
MALRASFIFSPSLTCSKKWRQLDFIYWLLNIIIHWKTMSGKLGSFLEGIAFGRLGYYGKILQGLQII